MYYDRRVAVDRRGDQRRPPISAAAVYVLAMGEGRPHGLDVVRLQRLEQRRLLVELDLGARGRRHRAEDEEGKGKESTTKHSAIPAKSVGGMIAAAAAIGHPEEIGRATSELQSLMRISYAVFCLKKKTVTVE